MILCLGLAAFAANIGLAALIGAFLAGMIVAETKDHTSIEEEVRPLYAFFPPFFFAFIGIELDLGALLDGHALVLLAAITAIAAAAKLVPAYLAARGLGKREAAIVGVGMIPRGEVGIVIAAIGAAEGVDRRRAVRRRRRDVDRDDARRALRAAQTQPRVSRVESADRGSH